MAVDVVTFGCRLNALESETMRARAAEAGPGDALLVNTCAVTAEAVTAGALRWFGTAAMRHRCDSFATRTRLARRVMPVVRLASPRCLPGNAVNDIDATSMA